MDQAGARSFDAVEAVRDTFGIDLPHQVMQTVFHRVVKANRGFLRDKLLHLDVAAQRKRPRLLAERASFERSTLELAEKLRKFSHDSFGLEMDLEVAEGSLYRVIAGDSLRILKSAFGGEPHEAEPGETPQDKATAAFITATLESDTLGTAQVENLAMGSTLAASVYLDSADAQTRKFRDTTVFLDTPIALKALGYEGSAARDLTLQTIELARTFGARIAIFEHSVKEVQSVLQGSIDSLKQHGRRSRPARPVDSYFRDNGFSAIEVQMFQARVEEDLAALTVAIDAKPGEYGHYGIDEKGFEKTLQKVVGYRQRTTLLNDLDSVAGIVRLRRGRRPTTLENSVATLLSDNTSLQRASRSLVGKNAQWDLVTLDSALATLLWLKSPTLAPTLPLVRVAADCLSALTPSKGFWEDFLSEVERQVTVGSISAEDAVALRSTIEAQHAIVVNTGGSPAKLTGQSVAQVRDQVVGALTAPLTERLDETSEALEAERRHTTELERQVTDFRIRETRLRVHSRRVAERWVLVIRALGGAILFISAALTTGAQLLPSVVATPAPWNIVYGAAVLIGSAGVAVGATFAIAVIPFVASLLASATSKIEILNLKRHHLEPTSALGSESAPT